MIENNGNEGDELSMAMVKGRMKKRRGRKKRAERDANETSIRGQLAKCTVLALN